MSNRCGPSGACCPRRAALGGFDMWFARRCWVSRCSARSSHGKTDAAIDRTCRQAQSRSTIRNRMARSVFRPADQRVLRGDQSRGKPALPPETGGRKRADLGQPAEVRGTGRSATARRVFTRWSRKKAANRALSDQLPELRALQDLRYQGPQPEHHLDGPAGRRRAELPEHVIQPRIATKGRPDGRPFCLHSLVQSP